MRITLDLALRSRAKLVLQLMRAIFVHGLAQLKSLVQWAISSSHLAVEFGYKITLRLAALLRPLGHWAISSAYVFGVLLGRSSICAWKHLPHFGSAVTGLRRFLFDIGIIVLLLTVVFIVVHEISQRNVDVKVAWLPEEFTKAGYTNSAAEKRIRDHIDKVIGTADTGSARPRAPNANRETIGEVSPLIVREEIRGLSQPLTVSVSGNDFSLSPFVAYWRGLVGYPDRSFVVEIVHEGSLYKFRARSGEFGTVERGTPAEGGDLDQVLEVGARAIVENVDPLTYAEHIYSTDPDLSLEVAKPITMSGNTLEQRSRAHRIRAASYIEKRQYEEAKVEASAATALLPDISQSWRVLGDVLRIYSQSNQSRELHDEAIGAYSKALNLRPGNVNAWVGKCQAFLGFGAADLARESCEQAAKLSPRASNVRLAWVGVLLLSNESDAALANLKQILEDYPDHHEARYRYGMLLIEAGRPAEAAEQLKAVLAAWPNFGAAKFELFRAEAHQRIGTK